MTLFKFIITRNYIYKKLVNYFLLVFLTIFKNILLNPYKFINLVLENINLARVDKITT